MNGPVNPRLLHPAFGDAHRSSLVKIQLENSRWTAYIAASHKVGLWAPLWSQAGGSRRSYVEPDAAVRRHFTRAISRINQQYLVHPRRPIEWKI